MTIRTTFRALAALGATLAAAPGHAAQIAACDQRLEYALAAPAPGAPAEARAFSGVWAGNWAYGASDESVGPLCAALIIESVAADGTAGVLYIWGKNENVRTPGNARHTARISGGTLSWAEGRTSYSFRMSGATLNATRRTPEGFESGRLSKR